MGSRTESIRDVAVQLTAENADRIKAATKGAGLNVYSRAGRDLDHYSFFHYNFSARFSCNKSLPQDKRLVTEREWMAILCQYVVFPITFPMSAGLIPAMEAAGLEIAPNCREWIGRYEDVQEVRFRVSPTGYVTEFEYTRDSDWPEAKNGTIRFKSAGDALVFLRGLDAEPPPFSSIHHNEINWNVSPTEIEVGCTPVTKDQVLAIARFKGWI